MVIRERVTMKRKIIVNTIILLISITVIYMGILNKLFQKEDSKKTDKFF